MPTNAAGAAVHVSAEPPPIGISFIGVSASVLVVAAPPEALLVASLRRSIEPLVHPPHRVESARVRRICVIHYAVLEHERAHAGSLADVGRHVDARRRRDLANDGIAATKLPLRNGLGVDRPFAMVVVVDALALL